MIQINFFKGDMFVQRLIRWFTKSDYSHVSISVDGVEYEASFTEGVRIVKKKKKPDAVYVIENPDTENIKKFLKNQVGKGYDDLGILSFIFPGNWQRKKEWFCSELAGMALKKIGSGNWGKIKTPSKLSPGDLFKILQKSEVGSFET